MQARGVRQRAEAGHKLTGDAPAAVERQRVVTVMRPGAAVWFGVWVELVHHAVQERGFRAAFR